MTSPAAALPEVTWVEPQVIEPSPDLLEAAGGQPFLAEALARRRLGSYEQARAYLDPAFYTPAPPSDLPGLPRAVDRLQAAVHRGELIGVWGDFDVDGQTSTTILVSVLRALGGKVVYHIPVRERESHGVNLAGLQSFVDGGVQVVLTCDTGITAHEAADYARASKVDFIITDHHTLPPVLPISYAAVNPQFLPENHPLRTLPGAGTAFKLAEELAMREGRPEVAASQIDLAAMGTVADLATLTGDARYIVQRGLSVLRESPRLAVQAILQEADARADNLSEEMVSFVLSPRLNAIGRLDDANPVVEFLTTSDITRARVMAAQLESLNNHRKMLCDQVFAAAQDQIERDPSLLDSPVLVLSQPHWHPGVIGIVASRLVELYHRPTLLIAAPPGSIGRGSARSIDGINITSAIAANASLLKGFGGHPMAAGLGIDPTRIPALQKGLAEAVAGQIRGRDLSARLVVDSYLDLGQIQLDLVEQIERLAPFGPGNPAPILATRNLVVNNSSNLGKTGEHKQWFVQDEAGTVQRVILWQGASIPVPPGRFDLAYSLRASTYSGQREVQLTWTGMRLTAPPAIEFVDVSPSREIFDCRQVDDPREEIQRIAACEPGLIIWQEGENLSPLPGCDRYHLSPAPALAIWTIPPSRAVLEAALQVSGTRRLYLFGQSPPSADVPRAFLNRLSGLVRYALKEMRGQVSVARLAAATAQRETAVEKGLSWLEAKGSIQVVWEPEGDLILLEGGKAVPGALPGLEIELRFLLQETAAYRSYLLRANPASFVDD